MLILVIATMHSKFRCFIIRIDSCMNLCVDFDKNMRYVLTIHHLILINYRLIFNGLLCLMLRCRSGMPDLDLLIYLGIAIWLNLFFDRI